MTAANLKRLQNVCPALRNYNTQGRNLVNAGIRSIKRPRQSVEPHIALTPGPRGTEAIERILEVCRGRLSADPGPAKSRPLHILMEVGFGQEQSVRDVAAAHGFTVDDFLDDLAAIPRVVVLSRDGE